MPDAATALEATGYERGTITPFGSTTAWPVVADERLRGRAITLGAGAHGVAIAVDADSALAALDAVVPTSPTVRSNGLPRIDLIPGAGRW